MMKLDEYDEFSEDNNAYWAIFSLCQLVFEGMLLTTDDGVYKLVTFIDKQRMNIFETGISDNFCG